MSDRGHLASDTCSDAERRQIEIWRRMTPLQKLELVGDLRQTVLDLALAGIRSRHPAADERECFLRLMRMTLGPQLAAAAYPELAQLPDAAP
jgi:hypothetical protein